MLPKKERFNTTDLSKLHKKENRAKFKKIIIKYGFFIVYESGDKKGIILSKKNFKTAVLRNKYKRLFYNTVLEVAKTNPKINTTSFILHPKQIFDKVELKYDMISLICLQQ